MTNTTENLVHSLHRRILDGERGNITLTDGTTVRVKDFATNRVSVWPADATLLGTGADHTGVILHLVADSQAAKKLRLVILRQRRLVKAAA